MMTEAGLPSYHMGAGTGAGAGPSHTTGGLFLGLDTDPESTVETFVSERTQDSSETTRIPVSAARRTATSLTSAANGNGSKITAAAAMSRSEAHELKHVVRQQAAYIASLENRLGIASTSSTIRNPGSSSSSITGTGTDKPRIRARSRHSLPAPGQRSTASSPRMGIKGRVDSPSEVSLASPESFTSDRPLPFSDVANTTDAVLSTPGGGSAISVGRRRRKEAIAAASSPNGFGASDQTNSPNGVRNQLGLQTVPERKSSVSPNAAEGFLSPTIASENRRLATFQQTLGSPVTSSPGAFAAAGSQNGTPTSVGASGSGITNRKESGKVIESLSIELNATRSTLVETRAQIQTTQRTVVSLQRSLDESRGSLERARTENKATNQMLARKDRQIQEALERARKAEAQSKELGKSSREWGARVRNIEDELGQERILKQRAEVQYEAIASSWKQTRELWEKEMKELRMNEGDALRRNREQINSLLTKFKHAEETWHGREEDGEVLKGVIKELEAERARATDFVEAPVRNLSKQLKQHEAQTAAQEAAVKEVQDELQRILRLMRSSA